MLNQIVVVGRIAKEPEIKELEDGKKVTNLSLAVPRSYKNEEGVYETDFVDCTLWNGVAENVKEFCRKGDIVGVKGRIQTNLYEDKDGNKKKDMSIIAEKVTFLSSKKEHENENDNDMEV